MEELKQWLLKKIEESKPCGNKGYQFDFGQHCAFQEVLDHLNSIANGDVK